MHAFDETLGPLARLAGTWEGDKGDDVAPSVPDRGVAKSTYRERIVFEPIGSIQNHEQTLSGLRYRTTAWRIGSDDPFHEEVGYWLWDPERELVMRCFLVPRGISVIAGGSATKGADSFALEATLATWREMIENIAQNDGPDLTHTLNYLSHPGTPILLRSDDPIRRDMYFRFNQSLQEFVNASAAFTTTFPQA